MILIFLFQYRTIVDKQSLDGTTIFQLLISSDKITIVYLTADGVASYQFNDNYIPPLQWSHVAIQV